MRTYIETATKDRFAVRFMLLEDHVPTDEYIVVMKLSKSDNTFLVHRYKLSGKSGYEDLGTVRMSEDQFFSEYTPHCDYNKTSLRKISDTLENLPLSEETPKSALRGRAVRNPERTRKKLRF